MNNPVLQSEGFERAAFALKNSMEHFDTSNFELSVQTFARAVEKMGRLLGMQAENDYRKACGHQVAYTESDFFNV